MTLNFIKYPGGKFYLWKWIVGLFPDGYQQMRYVETFGGGATVLLNKEPSAHEVLNEFDPKIWAIYKTIKNGCHRFVDDLSSLDYCEPLFAAAKTYGFTFGPDNTYNEAFTEFVIRRMSRGGYGKDFAWSDRLRGGIPGDMNAWQNALKKLPQVSARLQNVLLCNEDALTLIPSLDGPQTLFYCDPEYAAETLVSKDPYRVKFSTENHIELSEILDRVQGQAVVSGYNCPLYERLYTNWNRHSREVASHAGQTKTKGRKIECCWTNY